MHVFLYFFFFKQKTAYEMRISDWRSDVCSSDLFGDGGSATGRIVQLVVLLTVITLAPSILVIVTSFVRIVVVLSLLRVALGTQSTPPNVVLISLALFLTFFIMQPTLQASYEQGIAPLIAEEIDEATALERAMAPVHAFMMRQVRQKDLDLFLGIARVKPEDIATPADTPYRALIPAFMISELRRAFEIGFLLFVPFLIIDMVVASVLMRSEERRVGQECVSTFRYRGCPYL